MKNLVRKWLESRKGKSESEYEEEKRKIEMAMGKPFITIKVEIPSGFENLRAYFLSLEEDEQFHEEVKDLIKKRLKLKELGRA